MRDARVPDVAALIRATLAFKTAQYASLLRPPFLLGVAATMSEAIDNIYENLGLVK